MFKVGLSCEGLTDCAKVNHGKSSTPLKSSRKCGRRSRIANEDAKGTRVKPRIDISSVLCPSIRRIPDIALAVIRPLVIRGGWWTHFLPRNYKCLPYLWEVYWLEAGIDESYEFFLYNNIVRIYNIRYVLTCYTYIQIILFKSISWNKSQIM